MPVFRKRTCANVEKPSVSRSIRTGYALAALILIAVIGGYVLAARLGADPQRISSPAAAVFTESTWPFPVDQWGEGWAYRCKAADCGTEVDLYLRPKIGFCNCQTGVADDDELDRVGDVDLFGGERAALGPGAPITVQWMKGRSRGYAVGARSSKSVLSLAFNDRCDVIVATVVAGNDPSAQEEAVLAFLNGDTMRNWAEQVLGR